METNNINIVNHCRNYFLENYGNRNYYRSQVETTTFLNGERVYSVFLFGTDVDRKSEKKIYKELQTYLREVLSCHSIKLNIDYKRSISIVIRLYTTIQLRNIKLNKITNKINGK